MLGLNQTNNPERGIFYVTMSNYGQSGGAELLVGQDGNALNVVGFTSRTLRRRQIDKHIIQKFENKCFDSEYDTLLSMSRIALDNTDPDSSDTPSENIESLEDLITQSKS